MITSARVLLAGVSFDINASNACSSSSSTSYMIEKNYRQVVAVEGRLEKMYNFRDKINIPVLLMNFSVGLWG